MPGESGSEFVLLTVASCIETVSESPEFFDMFYIAGYKLPIWWRSSCALWQISENKLEKIRWMERVNVKQFALRGPG